MQLSLYRTQSSVFVLVPTCFLPPQEAEKLYGPLLFWSYATLSHADAKAWSSSVEEIDRHSYAVISRDQAQRLYGNSPITTESLALESETVNRTRPFYRAAERAADTEAADAAAAAG